VVGFLARCLLEQGSVGRIAGHEGARGKALGGDLAGMITRIRPAAWRRSVSLATAAGLPGVGRPAAAGASTARSARSAEISI
jgi:hypothetical protein